MKGIIRKFYNMSTIVHDFNNFNVKATVNLKGSGCNIWKVFEVLYDVSRDIFKDTVFGYLLDVPRIQGDGLLFHKMYLHQIRPDVVLSPDGINGDTKLVYGPEDIQKNIGKKVSEKIVTSKKRCLLRELLFPTYKNSSVKIGNLKFFILNQPFLEVDDADAVRVCLIYILCECFLGKEINDRNLDFWNNFAWGSYL
uniref:DUF1985 domain-containing protein n=1 Tax=Lactuca sativa TaxID=4236 RepID=A0A9R1XM80_LACSA|nr:hypothetical protein LSAT_V11C400208520 [Lactuca sativa]